MSETTKLQGTPAMTLIDQLHVARNRGSGSDAVIQLLAGDLAALPAEHAVDALVVSAFPNSYTPNPGTLFESLNARGLDMREVALRIDEDERRHLGCWLSKPLAQQLAAKFHFKRIICFEPAYPDFVSNSGIVQGSVEDAVGFVFRCLNHFAIPDPSDNRRFEIGSVAMPLLATGNQRASLTALFPKLLEAAVFWLEQGLPVSQLKIVAFRPEDLFVARRLFEEVKSSHSERVAAKLRHVPRAPAGDSWEDQLVREIGQQVTRTCDRRLRERLMGVAVDEERTVLRTLFERMESATSQGAEEFDLFISYAHKQDAEVEEFVRALQQSEPRARVFYDKKSIPVGGQWIRMLSDAVQKAHRFVAILSPDYTASPVCWDEFQCAKLKEYNTRQSVIKTITLYSEPDRPLIMGIHSYANCAEGDLQRLRASAATILSDG